ncbi:MAG: DUF3775 domain-containing protein [Rhodomicrobiaceae bacterium]
MAELTIAPDYVNMLAVKVRAIMGTEGVVIPDPGSNPTDDSIGGLQDQPEYLRREEFTAEIAGLNEREEAELVALMWLGREDAEPEEWERLVNQAMNRRERPTAQYLLGHPLLAEYWLSGLERLGQPPLTSGVEEI